MEDKNDLVLFLSNSILAFLRKGATFSFSPLPERCLSRKTQAQDPILIFTSAME
jgi:hypothetical protein